MTPLGEGIYELSLEVGEEMVLYSEGTEPDFVVTPVAIPDGSGNHYGLKLGEAP